MTLKSSRRSELRAEAHQLSPVVIIGDKGLTDSVIAEIDRSLKTHELIKVRAGTDDREARGTWMATICEKLGAEAVQSIGKVLVLYRENPTQRLDPGLRRDDKVTRGDDKVTRGNDRAKRGKVKPKGERPTLKPKSERGKPRSSRTKPTERGAPTGISRPRSRTPSAPPESEPRRRRPRSSR